ncbi:hypothetical protein [Longimicrobium terrae]|uniref:HEAT repeat domain-containing protein n=1 Tax=Longimicrobium terrae TaxID=1639882 RepID=A0A841H4M7_9BACT|nr:hypothetical protein [Longimicrobium terrae]MBB4638842.1 hypothetical protein [Longimicrobium terrae]MBB6073081.1 hypothetical protein [Longimicrobium terrae]NNC30228.1 hypothetical protein [Longimicrobium terrae]
MKTIAASLLAGAVLAGAAPANAQPNVVRVPGKVVEVLGLEDWTVPMLEEALRRKGEVSLASHACAVALQQIGFPAATSSTTMTMGDTVEYVTLTLVEPADSVRVRRLYLPDDTTSVRQEWSGLPARLRTQPGRYKDALEMMAWEGHLPDMSRRDSLEIQRVWDFWKSHGTPADLALARRVLAADSGMLNRVVAASLLAYGPATDEVLHQLMHSVREQNDIVSGMAAYSLTTLARTPRRVDWAPAVDDIHAILRGTSLWNLDEVMNALVATGADSTHAARFLAGGGEAVLARLDSRSEDVSGPARRFLTALRGEDLGADPAAWRAWVASLRAE